MVLAIRKQTKEFRLADIEAANQSLSDQETQIKEELEKRN